MLYLELTLPCIKVEAKQQWNFSSCHHSFSSQKLVCVCVCVCVFELTWAPWGSGQLHCQHLHRQAPTNSREAHSSTFLQAIYIYIYFWMDNLCHCKVNIHQWLILVKCFFLSLQGPQHKIEMIGRSSSMDRSVAISRNLKEFWNKM
jgi:hypothetical protein